MPILTLKFKDNVLGEYRLEKGKSLTIGRKEGNDVAIENLAVSGHHAKIDAVGDGYLLTDLKSKNGSFVNRQLVSSHWLQHGDVIIIGKHTLIFTLADDEPRPGPDSGGSMDQTMVMDTDKYREMLAKSGAESAGDKKGVLSCLSGREGEIELTKKLIKIGKNQSCDIVVGGFMMGQTAATISKRPSGYSLAYVEGRTKPKVNGETVRDSVMLKEFDNIEIGSLKMQFFLKN